MSQIMANKEDLVFLEDNDSKNQPSNEFWNILIVDDEKDVHSATKMVLKDFSFKGKKINFLHAYNAESAKKILETNEDTAIILLDVIMEANDSGLNLVKYVRENIKNNDVRIILRTGQPGDNPEEKIIIDYDINDYKSKTEMTSIKLVTSVVSALRAYYDIIEIKKLNKDILSLKNHFEATINSMPSMIISTDKEGIIKNWNTFSERKTGILKEEAIGKNIFSLLNTLEIIRGDFNEVILTGEPFLTQKMELSISNSKYFKAVLFCINDDNSKGVVFNLTDITEIELMEEKLKTSQKMELVGVLSSGLAHDFNNAIMSVSGPVTLLKYKLSQYEKNCEIDSLIEMLDLGISHMLGITKQFQSLTKNRKESYEPINLNEMSIMLSKICKYKLDRNVKIILNLIENYEPLVYGDMVQLQELFLNLCINAEHSMTIMRGEGGVWGGEITLSIEKKEIESFKDDYIIDD
ncbi:MAG TPA: PAS domain S-box protein, partial [Spirochaetota bacterium]|nr:PAS domain S-box protein [Spirochaetota bacterium]